MWLNVNSLGHCGDLDSKHTHGFPRGHPLQAELPAGELYGEFNLDLTQEERGLEAKRVFTEGEASL